MYMGGRDFEIRAEGLRRDAVKLQEHRHEEKLGRVFVLERFM
jgi:hypothetical protein